MKFRGVILCAIAILLSISVQLAHCRIEETNNKKIVELINRTRDVENIAELSISAFKSEMGSTCGAGWAFSETGTMLLALKNDYIKPLHLYCKDKSEIIKNERSKESVRTYCYCSEAGIHALIGVQYADNKIMKFIKYGVPYDIHLTNNREKDKYADPKSGRIIRRGFYNLPGICSVIYQKNPYESILCGKDDDGNPKVLNVINKYTSIDAIDVKVE